MTRFVLLACIAAAVGSGCGPTSSSPRGDRTLTAGGHVTVDNFERAETDNYFAAAVREGGFGKFGHDRDVADVDHQKVIRLNRDTVYSFGVFDLDAGPVTVALPDPGKRFMSMQVINEDHYAQDVFYAPGTHVLSRDAIGTRYAMVAIRTFVDPTDPRDIDAVHKLQDAIVASQPGGPGQFGVPEWDQASLGKMRASLLGVLEATGGIDSARMFGRKDQVDPVQHLLGTAGGWGGNPRSAATYAGAVPKQNDGRTPYAMTVRDVPVDGFWSVSVYNKDGFFEKNARGAYTVNNVTAKRDPDGSVTIHFGGDEGAANHIPIMPGWNYLFRLYRPREAILDGTWKAPEAEPAR